MYTNIKDIYEAIQAGEASLVDLYDFVAKREMEALQRGLDTMTNLIQKVA